MFNLADWGRGLVCFFFISGVFYLFLPITGQKFATQIMELTPNNVRLYGVFMLAVGFVLWRILF